MYFDLQEAIKENIKTIRFNVLKTNPSIEFYKKLGIENITETEGWQYTMMNSEGIIKTAEIYQTQVKIFHFFNRRKYEKVYPLQFFILFFTGILITDWANKEVSCHSKENKRNSIREIKNINYSIKL